MAVLIFSVFAFTVVYFKIKYLFKELEEEEMRVKRWKLYSFQDGTHCVTRGMSKNEIASYEKEHGKLQYIIEDDEQCIELTRMDEERAKNKK